MTTKNEKVQSISTRKGDKGNTSLLDGTRVGKDSLRPAVYGTLDEANAFMGLARARARDANINEILLKLQNLIYKVNAQLACPAESKHLLKKSFTAQDLDWVNQASAALEAELKLPPKFVIYGETEASAILDVARAVIRRAERTLVALDCAEEIDNPHIKPFINRLSDLLYLLARKQDQLSGKPLRHPD
jgi:cob(I)alamin adenosyltransferase